jgi:hypothetical protein
MDFGNAVLDGGFCDPDSIIPIETALDDEFFHESVIQSLTILQRTVQRLLDLSSPPSLYPSIEEFVIRKYIHGKLSEAVESERRPGLQLDKRFIQLLSPKTVGGIKLCVRRRHRLKSYVSFAKDRVRR